MGAGIYFGILLVILLFQIVAFAALKDPTFLWYAFWIASVLTFELAFDGLLPLVPGSAGYSLATINLLSQLAYVGFVTSYLNLRRSAPRLFVIFIGASMFTAAVPALAGIVLRHPAPQSYITVLFACSMGLAIVIAMLRRQAGFTPAAFLVFGLLGSFTMMALSALRDFVGPSSSLLNSAFLDRWSVQLGFVFDFLVFSIGVAYRARFAYGESVKIHAELDEATSAAGHDPLTGLLNRRGLERWIAASTPCAGTVLFFDLDDFKMVNDRGGHAAGDEVLNLVGHIIRQSVREHDAVSRFGGDEFVVVLDGATEPALIEHIVARITAAVARLLPLGPQSDARIGISFGTAPLAPGTSFADALGRADVEAYRMKTEHHARR
jgi:diguanylate cyclase (GGDEF)-like protein